MWLHFIQYIKLMTVRKKLMIKLMNLDADHEIVDGE